MVQNAFKLHSTTCIPLIRYNSTFLQLINNLTTAIHYATEQWNSKRNRVMRKNTDFFQFLVMKGRVLWGYGMEIPCVYKFTKQPRNVDMLNKLLDFSNNRCVRIKRTGNGLEEKSHSGRQQKQEGKITLRASKCCKVKSFRSFVLFIHASFLLHTAIYRMSC